MYGAATTVKRMCCLITILAWASAQCATNAVAGDFRTRTWTPKRSPSIEQSEIIFSGDIEPGDDKKLIQTLKDAGPGTVSIALNSSGGDMATALSMGEIVRTALLTTGPPWGDNAECVPLSPIYAYDKKSGKIGYIFGDVEWQPFDPSDPGTSCFCASACFFIWAAGIKRSSMVLAVHRPYLGEEDLRRATLDEVNSAYQQVAEYARSYLKKMNVDEKLIDKINAIEPNDLYYPSSKKLDSLTLTLRHYVPAINDWLVARCGAVSDADYDERFELSIRNAGDTVYKPKRYQKLLTDAQEKAECEFSVLYEERRRRLSNLW